MNRSKLALLCGAPLTAICGAAFILSPSGIDDYDLAEGPDYAYRVAVDDEGHVCLYKQHLEISASCVMMKL